MGVVCKNLTITAASTDLSTGQVLLKWKCSASGLDHFEVLPGYYSVTTNKDVQEDSTMNADTNNVDGWFQQHWTTPESTVASQVRFWVRAVMKRTGSDGNEYTEYGDWVVSSYVKNIRWIADQDVQRDYAYQWQLTPPATPSMRVTRIGDDSITNPGDDRMLLEFNDSSPRTGGIEVQRSVDGGSWAHLTFIQRQLNATAIGGVLPEHDQAAWSENWSISYTDSSTSAGHSYRYRARSRNMTMSYMKVVRTDNNGDKWAVYCMWSTNDSLCGVPSNEYCEPITVITKPAAPTFSSASLTGGNSVTLQWTENGKTTDHYDVQYSSYRNSSNTNAWNAGALDEISHMSVPNTERKATVSNLAYDTTWDFRVYAVNDKGEVYGKYTGSDGSSYATRSVKVGSKPAPNFSMPSAFKGSLLSNTPSSGSYSAYLTWSDRRLTDDKYIVEHSTYEKAWTNNAATLIDSYTDEGNPDSSAVTHNYTWPSLDKGMIHYFRLGKTHGDATAYISTVVKVDVPMAGGLTKPSSVTATRRDATSVSLNVTATALGNGESWQVQYTTDPQAFTQNIVNAISEVSIEEAGANPTITVSELDYGVTWYFRVRRRGESAVSEWVLSNPASITLPAYAGELARPTSLTCTVDSSGTTPIAVLKWLDTLETDATYVVQHTTQANAFDLNAPDLIDEDDTDGGSGTYKQYGYSITEKGITHYFRVYKKKDGYEDKYAYVLGSTSDLMVSAKVESGTDNLEIPANLAATVENGRVRLTWTGTALGDGESFQIQYVDYAEGFSDNADSISEVSVDESSGTSHSYTFASLDEGTTYWFRIRRRSSDAVSKWYPSAQQTAVYAAVPPSQESLDELGAPTPTSTQLAYALGDVVTLSWIHNSGDGAEQSAWQVELSIGDEKFYLNGTGDSGRSPSTLLYLSNPDYALTDGTNVAWRVRTQGAWEGYWSDWSRTQTFGAYEWPVGGIALSTNGSPLTSLPLGITVTASTSGGDALASGNAPLSCSVSIAPTSDTVVQEPDGTERMVTAHEPIWSGYYTRYDDNYTDAGGWSILVQASDVRLVGATEYEVDAAITTLQGMRASATATFETNWDEDVPAPRCSTDFDDASLSCRISPWCEEVVGYDSDGAPDEWALRDDTELSVWRVNQDGSTELVESGLANDGNQWVVDKRCAFGTCTYRIVATDTSTGAQASTDYSVETPYQRVVIEFGAESVELKYNVEWTEEHDPDVELLNFHGRSNPVAHWGTQRGHSARIRASLIKGTDASTLAKLRRLADYRGACYVREPTGLAWWASVIPTTIGGDYRGMNQSVDLKVTRVEV